MTEDEAKESLAWFKRLYGSDKLESAAQVMTNRDLADAIEATHSMIRSTGNAEPQCADLLTHLRELLHIQRIRSGVIG